MSQVQGNRQFGRFYGPTSAISFEESVQIIPKQASSLSLPLLRSFSSLSQFASSTFLTGY